MLAPRKGSISFYLNTFVVPDAVQPLAVQVVPGATRPWWPTFIMTGWTKR